VKLRPPAIVRSANAACGGIIATHRIAIVGNANAGRKTATMNAATEDSSDTGKKL
jgi:hypothetical protein